MSLPTTRLDMTHKTPDRFTFTCATCRARTTPEQEPRQQSPPACRHRLLPRPPPGATGIVCGSQTRKNSSADRVDGSMDQTVTAQGLFLRRLLFFKLTMTCCSWKLVLTTGSYWKYTYAYYIPDRPLFKVKLTESSNTFFSMSCLKVSIHSFVPVPDVLMGRQLHFVVFCMFLQMTINILICIELITQKLSSDSSPSTRSVVMSKSWMQYAERHQNRGKQIISVRLLCLSLAFRHTAYNVKVSHGLKKCKIFCQITCLHTWSQVGQSPPRRPFIVACCATVLI